MKRWGEEIIPRVINGLIDQFEDRGEAELVTEFSLNFPFHFIHELMGLPLERSAASSTSSPSASC